MESSLGDRVSVPLDLCKNYHCKNYVFRAQGDAMKAM
jgi:hypothetical protein